jgi:large subunit ribosomal protein L23
MDLTLYDIILGPVVTEKAYELNREDKKLVVRVHPQANKIQIKQALEKLFEVKVEKVNVAIRKGKTRLVGRRKVQGSLSKKAFVTLKEGYSLDVFNQSGTGPIAQTEATDSQKA